MRRLKLLALGLIVSSGGALAQTVPGLFRAGAATSNITPDLGAPIVGGWESPAATHIHDELHARCLALDDDRTRLAIVVCDNVGIARAAFDEAKRLVHEATGLPREHMLMASAITSAAAASSRRSAVPPFRCPCSPYETR